MGSLTDIVLVAILAILGGVPTFALVFGIPATIAYKVYRKCRYHIAMTN